MERQNSPTRSVERALDILECFMDKDVMILLEIAEKTGLSSSTALRILQALTERDFIVKNTQDKTYRLGNKILWLAERMARESHEELRKTAYMYMLAMNEKYNEDVRLFVPDGHSKLCIESIESRRELRQVVLVGTRHDLIRGAAGKIMIAFMNDSDRRRLIEDESLFRMYDSVREAGYAVSNGEREEGLFGIAVPVTDAEGKLVAAISLSGPSVRFRDDDLKERIHAMTEMGKKISAAWQKRNQEVQEMGA